MANARSLQVPMIGLGWLPLLATALRLTTPDTANLSYVLLAVLALYGRTQAIQALALLWLFSMLSPGLAPPASFASVGRYLVIAAAAVSVLMLSYSFQRENRIGRLEFLTALVGVFIVFHSLLFSSVPDVSILKAVSWTALVITLLVAWSGLSNIEADSVNNWLYGLLVLILLLSVPLLFSPLGYLRNDTGFQGVLSHPQTFGPVMAILCILTIGRLIKIQVPSWSSILLVVACLFAIIMSEARTAGIALVLGFGLSVIWFVLFRVQPIRFLAPAIKSRRVQWLLIILSAGLIMGFTQLSFLVDNYLSKSGRAEVSGLIEAYEVSRGSLIEKMLENIEEKPWTGIGFGIASNLTSFDVDRDPIFGMPISAVTEKGVFPVMVLEELGVLGAILIAYWFFILFKRAANNGVGAFALLLVILLLNLGEATLFSLGGNGLLQLILLTWAVSRRKSQVLNLSVKFQCR